MANVKIGAIYPMLEMGAKIKRIQQNADLDILGLQC
jgi:hypothetical protein